MTQRSLKTWLESIPVRGNSQAGGPDHAGHHRSGKKFGSDCRYSGGHRKLSHGERHGHKLLRKMVLAAEQRGAPGGRGTVEAGRPLQDMFFFLICQFCDITSHYCKVRQLGKVKDF